MRTAAPSVALALLALTWNVSTADADGVIIVAGGSPRQRESVVAAFSATAKGMSWTLTTPTLPHDQIDASTKCLTDPAPWTCLAPALRSHDQVVIVQLENDRSAATPQVVATAHVLVQGIQGEIAASRYSALGDDEAFKRSAGALSKLLQDAAERTGRSTLVIRSRPDKAWITLDGKNIGATEKSRPTYPGLHTVSLRRIGYKAIARDVIVVEGKVTTEDFALEADSETSQENHVVEGQSAPLWPKLTIAAGAAALAAGVFWLSYDEDVSSTGSQKPTYHDTERYGYASLAVGTLAVGVGVYFWLRPGATSAAAVSPQRGGVVGGWAWRF